MTPRQTEVLQLIREGKITIQPKTFGWRVIHRYFDDKGVNVSNIIKMLYVARKITYVSNNHNVIKGIKVVEEAVMQDIKAKRAKADPIKPLNACDKLAASHALLLASLKELLDDEGYLDRPLSYMDDEIRQGNQYMKMIKRARVAIASAEKAT